MIYNCPEIYHCVFTEHAKNRPVSTNVYNVHSQYQTCIDMVTTMTYLDTPPLVRAACSTEILPHKLTSYKKSA